MFNLFILSYSTYNYSKETILISLLSLIGWIIVMIIDLQLKDILKDCRKLYLRK